MSKHLKFDVPEESPTLDVQGGPAFGEKPLPTISFPASEEQVNAIGVGDMIKVTFEGEVMSATGGKGLVGGAQSFEPTEITLAISESDIVADEGDGDISGIEEMGRDDPADIFS